MPTFRWARAHGFVYRVLMPIALLSPRLAVRVVVSLVVVLSAAVLLIPACNHDDSRVTLQSKPVIRVACTISVLTDAAFQVGYPRAEAVGLINGPANPHVFEPTGRQLELASDANLVLAIGLDLERRMLPMLSKARERKSPVVMIGDAIDKSELIFPAELGGKPDPHVWFDASLWAKCVMSVRDAMIKADPDGRTLYEKNAAEYAAKLRDLHDRTVSGAAGVPKEHRVIVSSHASFAYFARAYGFEAFGLEDAGADVPVPAAEFTRLTDLIAARRLPAIFTDIHTPEDSIERLARAAKARGHDVLVSGPLYGSSTGEEGTSVSTFQGMFLHNLGHIFTDLGGSPPHEHK